MAVHLPTLNDDTKLGQIDELLARRKGSPEHRKLDPPEIGLCGREYDRLTGELEEASGRSTLPEHPAGGGLPNKLLIRIRKSESPS